MIDGTAVKEFERVAQAALDAQDRIVEVDGITFSTTPLHEVVKASPQPAALELSTLSGLVEYAKENRDALDRAKLAVLVVAPDQVALVGPLEGRHQQRFRYAVAKPELGKPFRWGEWYELEAAKIALLSLFADSADRAELIRVLANVVAKNSVRLQDDGLTQQVTVKGGVKLMQDVPLKPTWLLAPFRTFTEVAQPASEFLMRLRDVGEGDVRVALFEADGGAWRREATARVQRWLRAELEGTGVPVIA
ncbi:MAG TPA: hypothetical protein VD970_08575 [Acetobacteraceae bacterium]|nr:hypothetical protein [Acetobacteraceae bacterium]